MTQRYVTIDGNEAVATIAHKVSEVIAIYPITPASPMGEFSDLFSAQGKPNLWGTVPLVSELQSEAGAAGTAHGALQSGALTTTFTASQGLLLKIPNMYKIAGELTPTVFHVSARTLATSALSIFGDHSDVMAVRATGFAMIASGSVQEVMDLSLISHAATLAGRIPILHFFDGFRTSHEVVKVEAISDDVIRAMIDDDLVRAHRDRALTPDRPVIRGTAMNPDVYFQAREAPSSFYEKFPEIALSYMERFAGLTDRRYQLFDYAGAPDAERVIVLMGSGAETAEETASYLNGQGERVGVVKVRLFRPFSVKHFVASLPKTVKAIGVLDRTKEPGSVGEPLYQDVVTALAEAAASGQAPFEKAPRVIGGRYGLSSKEFTPGMVKAALDELKKAMNGAEPGPKNHFTVGIEDDVCGSSLTCDQKFTLERPEVFQGVFFGLGADGTVSANKNSIKIIGEGTDSYAQGYFVYDSKKSGSMTVSHLRVGPEPIRSTYLVDTAQFVACHQFHFVESMDMLRYASEGGVFLLNSSYGAGDVWDRLPRKVQDEIIEKKLKFYVVDAYKIAGEAGLGTRINTIMQTCFFKIAGIIPADQAIAEIKNAIQKTYGTKGEEIVRRNFQAVHQAVVALQEVRVPEKATGTIERTPIVSSRAPAFVQEVTATIMAGMGDTLPVSKIPCDGTFPTGTARWEKRNIALEIPVWDAGVCIQCGKCAFVCPHTAIRMKAFEESDVVNSPPTFKFCDVRGKELGELKFSIQVAPEDCTGCGLCVHVCPAKNKKETRLKAINMAPQPPIRESERVNYEYFLDLPEMDRTKLKIDSVRGSQFLEPLFGTSGACAGCGETPYVKLLSQLFGDRLLIGNATGCSSIYCGNLPTTPWDTNREGRGPTWNNSLFEDAAEFSLGFRLSLDKQGQYAGELLTRLGSRVGDDLVNAILGAPQEDEADIFEQRKRIAALKEKLQGDDDPDAKNLASVADTLVRKSVWALGGDGWAYDIGYGGLDHVLAGGKNVNILVMDTGVYSNTGGQMSKATPRGAVAKFAAAGKPNAKKDLGLIAMTYGQVYVAQVAFGASDSQTVRAFIEAEKYDGPSLILAYSHCIAHGINMGRGTDNHKLAVESGHWPLYRYNPVMTREGKNPLKLDSKAPKPRSLEEYMYRENRFRVLTKSHPEQAKKLMELTHKDVQERWNLYSQLAGLSVLDSGNGGSDAGTAKE